MDDKLDKNASVNSAPSSSPSPASISYSRNQSPIMNVFGKFRSLFSNRTTAMAAVLLLVVGVGAGIIATQNSTEIRQRASDEPTTNGLAPTTNLVCGGFGDIGGAGTSVAPQPDGKITIVDYNLAAGLVSQTPDSSSFSDVMKRVKANVNWDGTESDLLVVTQQDADIIKKLVNTGTNQSEFTVCNNYVKSLPVVSSKVSCIIGDLDGDRKISYIDGEIARFGATGTPPLDPWETGIVDVDKDGATDIDDANDIKAFAKGTKTSFTRQCVVKDLVCGTHGDVDTDGKISTMDSLEILYHILDKRVNGNTFIYGYNGDNAEIDGQPLADGNPNVTTRDMQSMERFLLGQPALGGTLINFPACGKCPTGNNDQCITGQVCSNATRNANNTCIASPNVTMTVSLFEDTDRDCKKGSTENPINGSTVKLNNPLNSVAVTANGIATFSNIPKGDFSADLKEIPAGYTVTTGCAYPAPLNSINNYTGGISLQKTSSTATVMVKALVIEDTNGNCTYNGSTTEKPLSGVTVSLSDGTTAVTASDGYATFNNKPKVDYTASLSPIPAGYKITTACTYPVPARQINSYLPVISLQKITYSISGVIYNDTDNDGVKDPDEVGIPGVAVSRSPGTVSTGTNDTSGVYKFSTGLLNNTSYTIRVTPLTDYELSHNGTAPNTNDRVVAISNATPEAININFGLKLKTVVGLPNCTVKTCGACTLPANTCGTAGTKICKLTTLQGGSTACNQVLQPNESCTGTSTCTLPKICTTASACVTPTGTLPTATIGPTATTAPGVTIVPTATGTPTGNGTKIALILGLDGIGAAGDNTNKTDSSTSVNPPKHLTREVSVQVFKDQTTPVTTKTGTVKYNTTSKLFTTESPIDLGIANGDYTIKVTIAGHLTKRLRGSISFTAAAQTASPVREDLTAGDIDGSNILNASDYTILKSCSPFASSTGACTDANKALSDLNDDDVVNLIDFNLFRRELKNQFGD